MKLNGSSFLATDMSLTYHEEIGRVGRGCYEVASDLLATSRAYVGLVDFAERHDTRTYGQHYTPQQTAGRPIR